MAYVCCCLYSFFLVYFLVGKYQNKAIILTSKAFKFILFFPAFYWLLLLGMQYYVGSDYPTYYKLFETNKTGLYQKSFEYSFVFICNFINKLNMPPQTGFFIVSFVDVLFFCLFLSKFNFERPDLFLVIYFCCATAFVNQQNALRQYAAMNIFLFAFYFAYKRKLLKFLFLIIFASTFHRTAILLILIYPFDKFFKIENKKLYIIELFLGVLFCFKGIDCFVVWFVKFTPYSFYLDSDYFLEGNRTSFLNIATKLIYLPFFIRAIKFKKNFSDKEKFLFHSGICFYSIKLVSMSSFFLGRFAMYFDVLSYLPLYLYFFYLIKDKAIKKYSKVLELFIFLCVVIGPYLLKTVISPAREYLYKSILFK